MSKSTFIFCTWLWCHVAVAQVKMTDAAGQVRLPDGFRFQHPMTVSTPAQIAVVKARIQRGVEPQTSAYRALIKDADALQTFKADPPAQMVILGGSEKEEDDKGSKVEVRDWLWRNSQGAYASALAHVYSGEEKYAIKAVEILNAWAAKGTTFTGKGCGLQLGNWLNPMLYAVDLLDDYKGWSAPDRARFERWWRQSCLPFVLDKLRNYYNNHGDAGTFGSLTAALAFEDRALLAEAISGLRAHFRANPAPKVAEFGSEWKITKDPKGVYLTLEVPRREGRAGLTYSYLSLTMVVQCLQMARTCGYDFWESKTPQGGGYEAVIVQLYQWGIRQDAFPWSKKPDALDRRDHFNIFELANCHYALPAEMRAWLSQNRPGNGAQGDFYSTLNHGDIFPRRSNQP